MAKKTYIVTEEKLHPKFKYVISKKTYKFTNKLNALKKTYKLLNKKNVVSSFYPSPKYRGKYVSIKKALELELAKNK